MFHSAFKDLIQIIVNFRAEKIFCMSLSIKHPFEGHEISVTTTIVLICENEKLISFSYTIWFMISEKNITRCTFLHCGACMHQKSQQSIQKIISAL